MSPSYPRKKTKKPVQPIAPNRRLPADSRPLYPVAVRFALLVFLILPACVERRLFIKTDPPGAIVRVNGREVGRSPAEWRFDQYGEVLVEAELDRHQAVQRVVSLKAPAREWVLGGFFTDVLWPGTIHDDREVVLKLERVKKRSETQVRREIAGLQSRALKLRSDARKQ